MKHWICFIIFTAAFSAAGAQELYVFTEPASNMPAKSISGKVTARYPDSKYNNFFKQRYTPELMVGINKEWMVHLASTFSDFYTPRLAWESARLYAKYRFYSNDDIHRHFRLAVFAEGAYSRSPFLYEDINLWGDNNGVEAGVIATQLLGRFAFSGSGSVLRVFAKNSGHDHKEHSLQALNYSVSAGYLLFPKNYTDYKQTNINLYLEMLGMRGLDKKHSMLDLAPAVQVIINSNLKINAGYRFQLTGNMLRVGERGMLISVERTFLGAFGRRK